MGIGDWGLGIGTIPQSTIILKFIMYEFYILIFNKYIN